MSTIKEFEIAATTYTNWHEKERQKLVASGKYPPVTGARPQGIRIYEIYNEVDKTESAEYQELEMTFRSYVKTLLKDHPYKSTMGSYALAIPAIIGIIESKSHSLRSPLKNILTNMIFEELDKEFDLEDFRFITVRLFIKEIEEVTNNKLISLANETKDDQLARVIKRRPLAEIGHTLKKKLLVLHEVERRFEFQSRILNAFMFTDFAALHTEYADKILACYGWTESEAAIKIYNDSGT